MEASKLECSGVWGSRDSPGLGDLEECVIWSNSQGFQVVLSVVITEAKSADGKGVFVIT